MNSQVKKAYEKPKRKVEQVNSVAKVIPINQSIVPFKQKEVEVEDLELEDRKSEYGYLNETHFPRFGDFDINFEGVI